ncbi:hypothetical protein [Christiangramia echinicola]|uniref:hypothetical protein n=1 Tax=Christiangramia echinicola TaxID=279359 RepID=UPI00040BD59E|nr:hypothetical protein [Christiangramia echinicola]
MKPQNLIPAFISGIAIGSALIYKLFQNDKTITLTVDTRKINDNNIEETTFFGTCKTIRNSEYTTCVKPGEKIKWEVKALDPNGPRVKFVKFKHDSGNDFFGNSRPHPNSNKNEINGTISSKPGRIGDIEKYSLEIEVRYNPGGSTKTFPVDPKLLLTQN